jgi:hypothetical protein
MYADLHALVVLGAAVAPLIAIGLSPGRRVRPVRAVLIGIAPIAAVAMMSLLILSATGVPISEWAVPLAATALAGLFVKSQRLFDALRWSLFVLAVLLCLNAMALRADGYASSVASGRYQALEQNRLAALGQRLRKASPANQEYPPGPLATVLAEPGIGDWDRRTLEALWHTAFTGLYEVRTTPGEVWYPGGPVATGSQQLSWKPKD